MHNAEKELMYIQTLVAELNAHALIFSGCFAYIPLLLFIYFNTFTQGTCSVQAQYYTIGD